MRRELADYYPYSGIYGRRNSELVMAFFIRYGAVQYFITPERTIDQLYPARTEIDGNTR